MITGVDFNRYKGKFLRFTYEPVFKNGPSKICGRQPLKNLKGYGLLKQTISEVVYVTFGNPAICFALYLTGVHFRDELQYVIVSKKSSVDQSEVEK